jgi:hypothetical protein
VQSGRNGVILSAASILFKEIVKKYLGAPKDYLEGISFRIRFYKKFQPQNLEKEGAQTGSRPALSLR